MNNSETNTNGFTVKGIDVSAGVKRFGGNEKMYKKALLKFANQHKEPNKISEPEEIKSFSHMIKGVSANLGAMDLSAVAASVEKMPEMGMDSLNFVLKALCGNILASIPDEDEVKVTEKGTAEGFKEQLSKLRDALSLCDPKSSEEIIAKLRITAWEGIEQIDYKPLIKAVGDYDFDEATSIIDSYKIR